MHLRIGAVAFVAPVFAVNESDLFCSEIAAQVTRCFKDYDNYGLVVSIDCIYVL